MYKRTLELTTFEGWSHVLNKAVKDFHKENGVYPHILVGNESSFRAIDKMANTNSQNKIKNKEGKSASGFVAMKGFKGPDYELRFCISENQKFGVFKLIFEFTTGDDDGGEELLMAG